MTHVWQPGQIFVFGSNLQGIHGAGAAKFAADKCGAVRGIGVGHTGSSYALPTCSKPGIPLDLDTIEVFADAFKHAASINPDKTYFLTRVGCGIAGFTDEQIAPLFAGVTANVIIPPEWASYKLYNEDK